MIDKENDRDRQEQGGQGCSHHAPVRSQDIEMESGMEVDDADVPAYWESASISAGELELRICHNGLQRRVYQHSSPEYDTVLNSLVEKFPYLAPGRVCTFYRYADGRTETKTVEY